MNDTGLSDAGLVLACLCLAPAAHAGLALMQHGLGRSRSGAHTMLATLCAIAVAALVFVIVGSHWAGWPGDASHVVRLGGKIFNYLGVRGPGSGLGQPGSTMRGLTLVFEAYAAALTAMIPISAAADRWRLAAICASTALLAGFVLPLYMHAVWGGGWIASLLHVTDAGGGVVQCVGGLAALSVVWITGPRIGKYTGGQPNAIPGHNIIQVLFGCLLALAGWSAFEVAASVLFYRAPEERLVLVPLNALLASGAALLAALVYTRLRFRKPDASICANGWVAGLVAQSVGGCYLSPAMSIVVGAVAGALAPFLIEMIEFQLLIDDPGGAIAIHLGAGLWGVVAGALFAETGQTLSLRVEGALVVIATLLGLVFPLLHCINLVVAKLVAFRVDRDGDWHGMDIRELGSGAYPEFVLHADDTIPR